MLKEIIECLQECDFGRFVSASGGKEKMGELAARIRKIVSALERT
jgi:hypothetical protein